MKKLITIILIMTLAVPALAMADLPDISWLTYDELIQLKDKINLAMWNSQEWQEVTVPPGLWKIGEDIPEGRWNLRLAAKHDITYVWYIEQPNELGKPFAKGTKYKNQQIATEDWNAFGNEYIHSVDFDMKAGWYFYCEKSIIFTPYTGKPDLGFK